MLKTTRRLYLLLPLILLLALYVPAGNAQEREDGNNNNQQDQSRDNSGPCSTGSNSQDKEKHEDSQKAPISLKICSPADGATVTSPTRLLAAVVFGKGRLLTQVLVDGRVVFRGEGPQIDTNLTLLSGTHSVVVQGADSQRDVFSKKITVRVKAKVPQDISAINHIIFMFQENRSFDSYFGHLNDYRQTLGLPQEVDGLPAGASNLNYDGTGLISSFHFKTACHPDLDPSWSPEHVNYNRFNPSSNVGLNDGFAYSAGKYARANGIFDVEGQRAMGYYDAADLPYYYFMATQFATSDRWFAPAPARTGPNRYYAVSGTSVGHAYPAMTILNNPTIFSLLHNAGISWRVYLSSPGSTILNDFNGYTTTYADHFVPASQFAKDAAAGTLAAVSLIEQSDQLDEHPGHNVQEGSAYVASLINALMSSKSWKDSVFILSWDETGAMYDHVPSPAAVSPDGIKPMDLKSTDVPGDFTRYGFRVPVIVVSPFTRQHYVSHTVTDHTAILKLIETRFHLPSMTLRDGGSSDMTEFFDFQSAPWRVPPTPPAQMTNLPCYYDRLP